MCESVLSIPDVSRHRIIKKKQWAKKNDDVSQEINVKMEGSSAQVLMWWRRLLLKLTNGKRSKKGGGEEEEEEEEATFSFHIYIYICRHDWYGGKAVEEWRIIFFFLNVKIPFLRNIILLPSDILFSPLQVESVPWEILNPPFLVGLYMKHLSLSVNLCTNGMLISPMRYALWGALSEVQFPMQVRVFTEKCHFVSLDMYTLNIFLTQSGTYLQWAWLIEIKKGRMKEIIPPVSLFSMTNWAMMVSATEKEAKNVKKGGEASKEPSSTLVKK